MTLKSIRTALVAGAAALLIGGMAVSPAWAYFTDSHETSGGIRISVEPKTDIEEKDYDASKGKRVFIKNTSEDCPVFIRAKVYTNAPEYLDDISGANWSGSDPLDWWYWSKVLQPGEYADEIDVKITFPTKHVTKIINEDGSVTVFEDDIFTGDNFNVIVVYEAVPIQFDADGNLIDPQAADWKLAFSDNGQDEG